jgi:hypothetical protein
MGRVSPPRRPLRAQAGLPRRLRVLLGRMVPVPSVARSWHGRCSAGVQTGGFSVRPTPIRGHRGARPAPCTWVRLRVSEGNSPDQPNGRRAFSVAGPDERAAGGALVARSIPADVPGQLAPRIHLPEPRFRPLAPCPTGSGPQLCPRRTRVVRHRVGNRWPDVVVGCQEKWLDPVAERVAHSLRLLRSRSACPFKRPALRACRSRMAASTSS